MRITSKGQVTIPVEIREKAGLMPDTEVDFSYDGKGNVHIFRAKKKTAGKSRGEKLVEHMRRFAKAHPVTMTTEEIMALTRGED
jgi:AbrB family looped-hinge helix DNA binding protein